MTTSSDARNALTGNFEEALAAGELDRKTSAILKAARADEHIAGQLRQARQMSGVSQENLADALGLSYQMVQKYETMRNRISAGRLWQISRLLRLPIGFFFKGMTDRHMQGVDQATWYQMRGSILGEHQNVLGVFLALNAENRDKIMRAMRRLIADQRGAE